MKLSDQVISLTTATRLKELGVNQESYFIWAKHSAPPARWEITSNFKLRTSEHWEWCAAFTVAELGEMFTPQEGFASMLRPGGADSLGGKWECYAVEEPYDGTLPTVFADTEADARGTMLAFLINNKLLSV